MTGEAVPESVLQAFEGHAALGLVALAAVMEMDEKTLRAHVRAGDITWVRKGFGLKRPRRMFTLADVAGFYATMRRRDECRSTGRGAKTAPSRRRSSTTTFNSTVFDFTALREQRRSGLPKT